MVDPGLLDTIVATFEGATQTGATRLGTFSFAALGFCATVAWYRDYGAMLASGHGTLADALGSALLRLLTVGIFYWLLKNGVAMTQLLLASATHLGGLVSGDPTMGATLRHPSSVLTLGLVVARPLLEMVDHLGAPGLSAMTNLPKSFALQGVWILLVVTFGITAIQLVMLFIEYNLSVVVAFIGVPWGVLPVTAFLAEFALGWLIGAAIRVLVVSVIIALAWPLLGQLLLPGMGPGIPDPSYAQLAVICAVSVLFTVAAWIIPARTAALAQRSLGLSGSTLLVAAAGTARLAAVLATVGRASGQANGQANGRANGRATSQLIPAP